MIVAWMKEKKFIWTDLAHHHHGDDIMARCAPAVIPAGPPGVAGAERKERPLAKGACARDSHRQPLCHQALLSAAL